MKVTHKLAVLTAAMGLSFAATAQSSVTLYGILDAGIRYQTVSLQGASASNFGAAYGVQSGNRFGLRGVEDIGNGNRVTFVLENGSTTPLLFTTLNVATSIVVNLRSHSGH